MVASSAQCASSITRTVGRSSDSSSINAPKTSRPSANARASGPPSGAASHNGPNVRGVTRSSHAATSSRARARPTNARTSDVLPIPASPLISAVEPRPASAPRSAPRSTLSGASRSSRAGATTRIVPWPPIRSYGPTRRPSTTGATGEFSVTYSMATSSSRSPVCLTFVPPVKRRVPVATR